MLVPLNTKVVAPGFAALFNSMMRKKPEQLIELAGSTKGAKTLQMQPFDDIEEAPGK